MKISKFDIPGPLLIEPSFHFDNRGLFFESFNLNQFQRETGLDVDFVQDNESLSAKNVLRGLHFQTVPKAQGKLVRVVSGSIFDVAVDMNPRSSNFGNYIAAHLSAENGYQIWIPPDFAHGFLAIEDNTRVLYKTTDYYSKEHESGVRWDDKTLNIKWPVDICPRLSEKDKLLPPFSSFHS